MPFIGVIRLFVWVFLFPLVRVFWFYVRRLEGYDGDSLEIGEFM